MYPAYLEAHKNGQLEQSISILRKMLESCVLCPRACKVNRLKGEKGFCKTGFTPKIYSYMPHHGEEPPVSGERGSGAIFFSHCNMACVYCQNFEFSQQGEGREVGVEQLSAIMLQLQDSGCHNINLVTPTHVLPQILMAVNAAVPKGLNIPLVYNTSGYELPEIIRMLDGIIDIYLADMRYGESEMAERYSHARDYSRCNQPAVKEMHRQVGVAKISPQGVLESGLIIRHLVLPENISGTREIMKFIAEEVSDETYISLMSQYTPYYKASSFKEIARKISALEYKEAQDIMHEYGLYNGWTQEGHGLESLAGINIKPI